MAWLLFILFLFFAWRAAAYFGQGRPQPGILSLGACALLLAGIFANYMMFQRNAAEPAAAAPAEQAEAAPAPIETPSPEPSVEAHDPEALDSFYDAADEPSEPGEEVFDE